MTQLFTMVTRPLLHVLGLAHKCEEHAHDRHRLSFSNGTRYARALLLRVSVSLSVCLFDELWG